MILDKNIKPKTGIWNLIPWVSEKTAQAIYPNIYIPRWVYKNLTSKNPSPWHKALVIHEQEHIKRQKEMGPLKWMLKYVFSSEFRFKEEIAADIPKFKFLKDRKLDPFLEKRARHLSGWNYFWPVSYDTAKRELEKIWRIV